jgi:hypothetical protein
MMKGVRQKSFVLGILVLFIVSILVPGITGVSTPRSDILDKKESGLKGFSQTSFGTPPKEAWNKTFGGMLDDAAYSVQQTTDGGYIIGGYTKSYGIAVWTPWLLKTDSNGEEQWNKTYTYYSLPYLSGFIHSVQQTNDGGYILGCSFVNTSRQQSEMLLPSSDSSRGYLSVMMLIKTDASGKEQWNRTYAGIEYSWCYCVRQTTDGGFIATGGGNASSSGSINVYLLKTSSDGAMQWLKMYGTSEMDEEGRWVEQTADGGYIISGLSDCNYDTDWGKIWLIKTDTNGVMSWNKKFEGTLRIGPETYGTSVQQTTDNGFLVAGVMKNQGCLIKTDSSGNEAWRKTPFLNDYSYFCYSGMQTSDGGYIVSGNGIIKTDALGNEQWNVTIPTPFTSCQQTTDGGYIIAGSTSGYYNGDLWLIKFEPDGGTPDLQFTIAGGLGVRVKITNNGTSDSSGVAWQIHVKGGIFGLINETVDGTVDIAAGESKTVGTGLFFGFGALQVTATVDEETKTASGTQLIILTMI